MPKRTRNIVVLLVLIALIVLPLAVILWQQKHIQPNTVIPPNIIKTKPIKPNRPLDTSKFTKDGYIMPLENNGEGSIYSPHAQLRGTVVSWSDSYLKMDVAGDIKSISVPANPTLHCFPTYQKGPDGTDILSSSVWFDLKQVKPTGKPTSLKELQSMFPVNKDIMVKVSVDTDNRMTADMFYGFGCIQ
jgi:hypothetical protein